MKRSSTVQKFLLLFIASTTFSHIAESSIDSTFLALCYPDSGNVVNVASSSQLSAALERAQPGDRIEIVEGVYDGVFTTTQSGTSEEPIVVVGVGRVVFTGRINLNSDYYVIEGLEFENSSVRINGGNHNRITRNLFHSFGSAAVYIYRTGDSNRVDHNEFRDALAAGSPHALNIEVALGISNYPKNNRFDHNYIHDFPHISATTGKETIIIGPAIANYVTNTVWDHNLIDNTDSSSVLWLVKTSGNVMYRNTLINNNGYVNLRTGNGTKIIENYLENNARDLRVAGGDHEIVGNYIRSNSGNGRIRLVKGDATPQQWLDCEVNTSNFAKHGCDYDYAAASNVLLAGNSADAIEIGLDYDAWDSYAVANTRIEDDRSDGIYTGLETNTTVSPSAVIPYEPATRLSPSQVGLSAPDPSCTPDSTSSPLQPIPLPPVLLNAST